MTYFVNGQSRVVHAATCGVGLSWGTAAWTPDAATARDRPCFFCLPEGLPGSVA